MPVDSTGVGQLAVVTQEMRIDSGQARDTP